ncbi:MAG: choice-of-anchor tandem repeat GloVer-containing protein, partial [Rhizomicrobium sp.]
YSFTGAADGGGPQAGLVADRNGNLYGTTADGGMANAGTVFKLTPQHDETVLYNFTGGADGQRPAAALFLGAKNSLYGTAPQGGANGFGTVFEVKAKK